MLATQNAIAAGLRALGVRGKVRLARHDIGTIHVWVGKRDFGLWDERKNTFVE